MPRDCYWLRGSIQDEKLVLWSFQREKQVYWASIVETVTGSIQLVATLDRLKAAVFTIYSNEHSIQLTIFNNGTLYYVSGSESGTNGTSVGEFSVNPQWISITSSEVDPTADVLSGVNYFGNFFNLNFGIRISNSSDNGGNGGNGTCCKRRYCNHGCYNKSRNGRRTVDAFVDGSVVDDPATIIASTPDILYSFRFIPTTVYLLGDCSDPITDANDITQLEENWVTSNKVVPEAFTNVTDCYTGVFYNYCRRGEGCSLSCRGACEMGFACEYNVTNRGFECIDPNPSNNEGDEFKRPSFWLILALIIVIMSAIAFVIVIYQYTTRNVENVDSISMAGEEITLNTQEVVNAPVGAPRNTLII